MEDLYWSNLIIDKLMLSLFLQFLNKLHVCSDVCCISFFNSTGETLCRTLYHERRKYLELAPYHIIWKVQTPFNIFCGSWVGLYLLCSCLKYTFGDYFFVEVEKKFLFVSLIKMLTISMWFDESQIFSIFLALKYINFQNTKSYYICAQQSLQGYIADSLFLAFYSWYTWLI